MSAAVNRLDLTQGVGVFGPEVRILVDGREIFDIDGQAGQDPAQLLDLDALVPIDPPRRIALYMCGCGCSGCSDLAPIIRRTGDRIEWADPRQYTGAFEGAFADEEFGPDDDHGEPIAVPDLTFDAAQYLTELARARADRAWESQARLVLREAGEVLRSRSSELSALGYWLRGIWEGKNGEFEVNLYSPHGQRVVAVGTSGPRDRQVQQIVEKILVDGEDTWTISFTNYGPLAGVWHNHRP